MIFIVLNLVFSTVFYFVGSLLLFDEFSKRMKRKKENNVENSKKGD